MNKPLLSICLLTYNHSLFIEQCLNGIFSQIVNFDFELLIYNDFSDDETCKIIDEYKAKHKNIIEYKTVNYFFIIYSCSRFPFPYFKEIIIMKATITMILKILFTKYQQKMMKG